MTKQKLSIHLAAIIALLVLVLAVATATAGPGDPMASSVNIIGAFPDNQSDTVTIQWYSDGTLKKTSTKTVNGGETTSIYVPNELAGVSVPARILAVVSTSKPANVVVSSSDQGSSSPAKGHAYRAMSKEASWQADVGDILYAPLVWKNAYWTHRPNWGPTYTAYYTSTFYLVNSYSEYGGSPSLPKDVSIHYYDYTDGSYETSQTVSVYPRRINEVTLPKSLPDGIWTAKLDAAGTFPYIQGIILTEDMDGLRLFDYPLKAAEGTNGYAARVIDGTNDEYWTGLLIIMNVAAVPVDGYYKYCNDSDQCYTTYFYDLMPRQSLIYQLTNGGDEGAVKIHSDDGDALVSVVVTAGWGAWNARAAYTVDFDQDNANKFGWYALNMYDYYGWDCVTPGQNASSNDGDTLQTDWKYPGGFIRKEEANVYSLTKRLFSNSLLPNNVVAGAWLSSKWERVAQVGQCLNDDGYIYNYTALVGAEGSIMDENQTGGMKVILPLVWTGR